MKLLSKHLGLRDVNIERTNDNALRNSPPRSPVSVSFATFEGHSFTQVGVSRNAASGTLVGSRFDLPMTLGGIVRRQDLIRSKQRGRVIPQLNLASTALAHAASSVREKREAVDSAISSLLPATMQSTQDVVNFAQQATDVFDAASAPFYADVLKAAATLENLRIPVGIAIVAANPEEFRSRLLSINASLASAQETLSNDAKAFKASWKQINVMEEKVKAVFHSGPTSMKLPIPGWRSKIKVTVGENAADDLLDLFGEWQEFVRSYLPTVETLDERTLARGDTSIYSTRDVSLHARGVVMDWQAINNLSRAPASLESGQNNGSDVPEKKPTTP